MENENKTRYEELKKEILKCIDNDYVMPKNIPFPFERSVLYKELDQVEVKTGSGLLIGGIEANNVRKPNVGIVIATGPRVPDYIVPRLRAYFNQNNDLEYFIGGQFYKMCDFTDIFAAIPEGTLTSIDTKDDKEIMREKKMNQEVNYNLAISNKEDEEKNRKELEKKFGKFKA